MAAPDRTLDTAGVDTAGLVALLVPGLLLAGAYVSEYGFGLFPCEMCRWQRWAHFAALVLALLGFVLHRFARVLVVLAAVAIAVSGLIGLFHAGVEYKWWQGFTSCSSLVTLDGGNPLDAIMNKAPLVSCDQPQWTLMGVSLAGFNFLFSMAGAALVLALVARAGARARG